ncbi:ABC transporter substrate-binding protein [uncultured Clostridium sp.]|uniref:ABC transporter substrate-binding protein n=1 Tax=uncultured Clostridium sp. TaxID=59620 RepID=UPI0025F5878F|nr:ABC transporter substrate-binding protein [uncultured Clostridium sp.]
MKKKTATCILAALTAVSACLSGCSGNASGNVSASAGSGSAASEGGSDPIQLTYWYSWQDKIAENNVERIQEFNETVGKENGIHVTAEYQGTYDDLHSKLKSAFVANEEPDVCVMEIASIKSFAAGGIIQPIQDMVAQEDVDDFYPGLMENCYVDGVLYGVPYLRSTPVLYYNKTLFEKAGLDPEKGPSDWEELAAMSGQLADIGVSGYGFISDIWIFEAFLRSNGGDTVNKDWTQAAFNSPQGVETAQYFKDGITNHNFKYYSGKEALTTDEVNQNVAMWITSTANLSNNLQLAEDNGYEIGTAFIPKNTQNKVPTGGCNLVMTSRLEGKEKEAAAMLINFMTSKDSAVKNHIKTGYLPTRQSIGSDERLVTLYEETPQYKVALEQLQYGSGRPMAQAYSEMTKTYQDAVDKIMTTDVDIQTELDTCAAACDSLLK